NEVEHIGVTPHPGGEALEAAQGFFGIGVIAEPSHVAVNAIRVGPVALNCNRNEAFLFDEALGYARSFTIELMRTVRGFADEYVRCVAYLIEQRVIVLRIAAHWPRFSREQPHNL